MVLEGFALALAIFLLRVLNFALGTIRMVIITRNMRLLASVFAFIEAFIFAVVIANVVTNLNDTLNLFAYCMGAAVGSYLGMYLEGRFITGYRIVNIITYNKGHELALSLRDMGFGVTESHGEGRDGPVFMLRSVVLRKEVKKFLSAVKNFDDKAFISIEEAHAVERGWIRSLRGTPS